MGGNCYESCNRCEVRQLSFATAQDGASPLFMRNLEGEDASNNDNNATNSDGISRLT
jgi:hypothetical protein